ncbi:general substrate transporter [Dipodascopsis uninucleata]
MAHGAEKAIEYEHRMSLREAIKQYPRAIVWSILFSSALKYGEFRDGSWTFPASWQSGLSNGARAGEFVGLLINGTAAERFGFRKTFIGSLVAMTAFVFVLLFAPNVETLLAGEILCGLPWGVFQTLAVSYASEVCPMSLKAFVASGVNRASVSRPDQWPYRIPFVIQWVWPIPLLIGSLFAPVSMVAHGARNALEKLASSHKDEMKKEISHGTSYLDCLKGVDRRRTEIVCGLWLVQAIYTNSAAMWAVGAMLIVFTFVYDFSVGPVTYALVSEIPSTRLKSKSIVIARALYNISNIVVNALTPYQLNPTAWNWGIKVAVFWSVFRLPEPKGRSYEELDLLFQNRVSARKFKETKIDPFRRDIEIFENDVKV